MSNEQEMREAFVEFFFTGMSDEYKARNREGFWLTCNWTSYKEKDWKTWQAATLAAEARIRDLVDAATELQAAQEHYDELDSPGGKRLSRLCFAREGVIAALAKYKENQG